jgi:hypothetical protein
MHGEIPAPLLQIIHERDTCTLHAFTLVQCKDSCARDIFKFVQKVAEYLYIFESWACSVNGSAFRLGFYEGIDGIEVALISLEDIIQLLTLASHLGDRTRQEADPSRIGRGEKHL